MTLIILIHCIFLFLFLVSDYRSIIIAIYLLTLVIVMDSNTKKEFYSKAQKTYQEQIE